MKRGFADLKTSCRAVAGLAVLLCAAYPFAVRMTGRFLFPERADGSLIVRQGIVIGSRLIGRTFDGPVYFHPRPSAAGAGYDATASGGSNLGPLSKTLVDSVAGRIAAYRTENSLPAKTPVPADAVTSSASGLDPHISPANARFQAPRVARARGLDVSAVLARVAAFTEGRDLGVLGEPRVNVFKLNLDLDGQGHGRR
jgi:potassium-transporting ATPase KdpC subunit